MVAVVVRLAICRDGDLVVDALVLKREILFDNKLVKLELDRFARRLDVPAVLLVSFVATADKHAIDAVVCNDALSTPVSNPTTLIGITTHF